MGSDPYFSVVPRTKKTIYTELNNWHLAVNEDATIMSPTVFREAGFRFYFFSR
jgi:hypothetical protein